MPSESELFVRVSCIVAHAFFSNSSTAVPRQEGLPWTRGMCCMFRARRHFLPPRRRRCELQQYSTTTHNCNQQQSKSQWFRTGSLRKDLSDIYHFYVHPKDDRDLTANETIARYASLSRRLATSFRTACGNWTVYLRRNGCLRALPCSPMTASRAETIMAFAA